MQINRDIRNQLVFLGTGTSHGVPVIGCGCATCSSPNPKNHRGRCSIVLGLPAGNLLVDTPPDLRMQLLREKLASVPNVLAEPKVEVEILEFTLVGPVLAVRPFCHNDHYWQVYFDGNRIIREALAEAGFPAAMPAQMVEYTV